MKAVWIIAALICALLGCWLFVLPQDDCAGRPIVAPKTTRPAADARHEPEPMSASERAPAAASAAVVGNTPPPAPGETEPTTSEAQALKVELPLGVIEGIVLRGRDPIATGGVVLYQRAKPSTMLDNLPDDAHAPGVERTNIDARGMFRTAGLEAADYTLAVDVGIGMEHEMTVRIAPTKPGKRIVIVLGAARVKGHIYDERGAPVAGARIAISAQALKNGSSPFRASRNSDPSGAYAITGLPAGSYWFNLSLSGEKDSGRVDSMQQITLGPEEERVLDFNSPEGSRTWSGTVRTRSGDPVRGGATLHLTRIEGGAYSHFKVDADGTFRASLQPGEYRSSVSLNTNGDERREFPPVRIGHVDLSQDLTFPGTRVSGIVVDAETGSPMTGQRKLLIGVRPRDGGMGGPSVSVNEDGRFAVDGIEPGVWLVSAFPLRLVEGDHEITITKDDVEIPLRLTVKAHE